MLRPLILALSRSRAVEHVATNVPGFRGFSRRFVAGRTQADALDAVRRLNAAGFDATVSFLGEEVTSEMEVRRAIDEFTSFATAAQAQRLRSHISIKLTELGLAFDRALAERSLETVVEHARREGTFVRIDMEDSRYTEATLEIFRDARRRHENLGVVIQAYLRRSAGDIERLARDGAPVRLVKGAYQEPESIAFESKREVDESYARLADVYFSNVAAGGRLAIATHDPRMVRAALQSARRRGATRESFEFQMLYGIRTDLQRALRARGHAVRIYVPYGSHWYPYMMRRLAERPANLWFFVRNVLRR
jgi:proline dehydrogenase